jgi:quercetin dioxygenase-like cupin family protein
MIDGQPPRALKPGDSFNIPAGVVHDARSGEKGAKVLATYIIERGKPLASPAK